jgi:cyclophilin family peptidyl-prolyl cis-trans isomerase
MFKKLAMLGAGLMLSASALPSPSVEMQTSMGSIVIELNSEKAPITVKNFLQYAKDGFYNGTIFHRTIEGFMIQGGGFTKDMAEKPTAGEIKNEAQNGLKNERGTIAMARRQDPNSASSQFFINHKDNTSQLDYPLNNGGYAVFGKVTQGMDVVDKIAKVRTSNKGMHQNVPVEPIIIQSIKIISDSK